jgi:hypothetical protein
VKTPEKDLKKYCYNFEQGYDKKEEICPFGDVIMGEEEEDDDIM